MAHHDERCCKVQSMIGAALQEHFVGLGIVLFGVGHTTGCPVVELIDNLLQRQLTLHAIQFESPFLHTTITLEIHPAFTLHHLEVGAGQGDTRQARCQSRAEVLLIHLLLQCNGRARIDIVPGDEEILHHGVEIRVCLTILLIVESLQFEALLVNP